VRKNAADKRCALGPLFRETLLRIQGIASCDSSEPPDVSPLGWINSLRVEIGDTILSDHHSFTTGSDIDLTHICVAYVYDTSPMRYVVQMVRKND